MTSNAPETEHIAAKAALGNPDAFAALVERTRGSLDTWVALRLGPKLRGREAEEDIVQETLLQAFRTLDTFEAQGPGSFRRWLLAVAEHRIKHLHRFHSAQKRDSAREVVRPQNANEVTLMQRLAESASGPATLVSSRERREHLVRAIENLDDDLREVVVGRALEERPFKDIAAQLGRPVTTVQAQYARGIRALKGDLDGRTHA